MKRIAIFASGTGSNAKKIIEYFSATRQKDKQPDILVALIVSNKPHAGVLQIAAEYSIPSLILEKEQFLKGDAFVSDLKKAGIDFIVLAGFLLKIPLALIKAFPKKIINIHPALLPKYGGKGMYGHHVHEAVIASKNKESGISIHYVDEMYDHGQVLLQVKCLVDDSETPETLAKKIQALEHRHFPPAIDLIATL